MHIERCEAVNATVTVCETIMIHPTTAPEPIAWFALGFIMLLCAGIWFAIYQDYT